MVVACERCGGPLDRSGSGLILACRFCGANNENEQLSDFDRALSRMGVAPPPSAAYEDMSGHGGGLRRVRFLLLSRGGVGSARSTAH
jgi:hypothetical protein